MTEISEQLPGSQRSRWAFLDIFKKRQTGNRESNVDGKLSDKEIQKQGLALITEARDTLRRVPEYASEQRRIYNEATSYRSTDRPMRISVGFTAGDSKFDVVLVETQNTDPLSLVMIKKPQGDQERVGEMVNINLRGSASQKPEISFTPHSVDGSSEQTPQSNTLESVQSIRRAITNLNSELSPITPKS